MSMNMRVCFVYMNLLFYNFTLSLKILNQGIIYFFQGLDALIEFKNTCGEADLSSFLQKSAESFSIFVEGDLKTGQPGGENKHRPGMWGLSGIHLAGY